MKRLKCYMETDIVRDRSKGKGEHLQTCNPRYCIFCAAYSAQEFRWVRARTRSATSFCHPKKPPVTVSQAFCMLMMLWACKVTAEMGHICSKANSRAMDVSD